MTDRHVRWAFLFGTLVCAVPLRARLPASSGDNGWIYVINLARTQELRFGHDVVFTYGPWGFLTYPLAVDRWGVVVAGVFCAASLALFCWFAQRWLVPVLGQINGCFAASLITLLFNRFSSPSWIMLLLVVGWALTWLSAHGAVQWWQPGVLLLPATLLLQVKFSEGVTALALVGALVLTRRSAALAGFAGGLCVLTTVAWWLLAGQRLTDILGWVAGAMEITAGYPEAMRLEPGYGQTVLLLALVMTALMLAGAGYADHAFESRRGLLAWVATLGLLWMGFKQGFVRNDTFHEAQYFSLMATVGLIGLRRDRRSLVQVFPIVLAIGLIPMLMSGWSTGVDSISWGQSLRSVADAKALGARSQESKAALMAEYGVPEGIVNAIGSRPVLVEPGEAALAFAYSFRLAPVPTLMPYSAYTSALDGMNRKAILEDEALMVLREQGVLDGRLQVWDSPRYNLTLLCKFREVAYDSRWSLLERSGSRCGARRHLKSIDLGAGVEISLPSVAKNEMLLLSYTPDSKGSLERAAHFIGRETPLFVELNQRRIRLPRAHADAPLVVDLPKSQRWPVGPETRPSGGTFSVPEPGRLTLHAMALS